MGTRRDREREERRKYILEKAQALFAQKSYIGTSMAEIAEASEFSVGSLYSFFQSKEEILEKIFDTHIDKILSATLEIRDNPNLTSKEKIETAIELIVRVYIENQDFYKIFVSEARNIEWGIRTELGKKIYDGSEKYLDLFSDILREGISDGIVDSGFEPRFLALILKNYIHSTVSHYIYSDQSLDIDEQIKIAKRMLFHGISPIK